jgi:hypothetical protein
LKALMTINSNIDEGWGWLADASDLLLLPLVVQMLRIQTPSNNGSGVEV